VSLPPKRTYSIEWIVAGIVLLFLGACIALLSRRFGYEINHAQSPIRLLVALLIASGAVHLLILTRIRRTPANSWLVAWMIGIGVILRVGAMFSEPILEDDFYRYLWDGGVLAHGFNPFTSVPEEAAEGGPKVSEELHALALDSGAVVQRVNHPWLATCYPPVAQLVFAVAHFAAPWSLTAWRLVLFAFDFVTLLLLFALLRRLGRSPLYAAVYWWCPLVIKEGFNSAHMDIAILPFVLGAVWFSLRSERIRDQAAALGLLGLAAGIKLWPVVLAPLLLRPLFRKPRALAAASAAFLGVLGIIVFALIPSFRLGDTSGFLAYGQRWQMNDALFMAIMWVVRRLPWVGAHASLVARGVAAGILALIIGLAVRREPRGIDDMLRRAMWITAALFLLSPTQFPWYYLWVLPFLVFAPRPSLLLLTALLPLYYLRFHFKALGQVEYFDYGIVWLEYVPVWCLLAVEGAMAFAHRKSRIKRQFQCGTA